MRVLITGGAGNVGKYVVRELQSEHELTILDCKPSEDAKVKELIEAGHKYVQADITDFNSCLKTSKEAEMVVHLAAIPHPLVLPPQEVFRVNAVGTFNIVEAATQLGIRRLVWASSDSVLGLTFAHKPFSPEYLPVDEEHPYKPQDAYGLSKVVGEEICKTACRRANMSIISLRLTFVWFPEDALKGSYRELLAAPERMKHSLWGYIDARDVAYAFAIAIKAELPEGSHETVFIAAKESAVSIDIREALDKFYPGTPKIASDIWRDAPLLNCSKAKRVLGWEARHSYKDWL